MTKVFNYETKFNGFVMSHTISEKVKVVTNLATLTSVVYQGEAEVERVSCKRMTISEYGKYLSGINEKRLTWVN
jgi:hypothetical protein